MCLCACVTFSAHSIHSLKYTFSLQRTLHWLERIATKCSQNVEAFNLWLRNFQMICAHAHEIAILRSALGFWCWLINIVVCKNSGMFVIYLHLGQSYSNYEPVRSEYRSAGGLYLRNILTYQTQWNHHICNERANSIIPMIFQEKGNFSEQNYTHSSYQRKFIACKTGWFTIRTWSRRFLASWKLHFHGTGPRIISIGNSIKLGSISNSSCFLWSL